MDMTEIRAIARRKGIKPAKARKAELIHRIQRAEGNFDCFASAEAGYCDQPACLWREDCFRQARKRGGLSP
ncbi:Rho termination factor N-terminal domain-containing protein [Thiohalorhabdus methylotrophus]|uniref:Rho termination factor N-terminal domain-containing protein n=1 Tax=Thiohalorhabdus methylotrophus TaxID=3242694 RepID=A0ABV4TWC0_9GAMM